MDPSCNQQHVNDLLSRVELPVNDRGTRPARSLMSVEQILEECGDDALVIGAHINGPDGLLELSGEQRIAVLRNMKLAGVEIHPDLGCDVAWLDGSKPQVGRKLSQVWGADSHSFDSIGQRFTWVKMTKPNLEGLRLALLDGEGLSHTHPPGRCGKPQFLRKPGYRKYHYSRREIDWPQTMRRKCVSTLG